MYSYHYQKGIKKPKVRYQPRLSDWTARYASYQATGFLETFKHSSFPRYPKTYRISYSDQAVREELGNPERNHATDLVVVKRNPNRGRCNWRQINSYKSAVWVGPRTEDR